ncbi:MAG: sugar phosphate isomerase/epimerase [Bryobacterales bacterium]|nr:sugar phosphate isomerase/epimerase [Bryobacterales bacterium]
MANFPIAVITDEFTQDFERICRTAVEMGIPALELRTIWNKNIVDMNDEEIRQVEQLAQEFGLEVVSIASPVFKCTLPDGGDIDHRFEQDAFHSAHTYDDQPRILKRSLELANIFEAPIVRVFSFWRTVEPEKITSRIIEALQGAVEKAAAAGVKIGLENEHACNIATASESAPILDAIQHPSFGLVWDPANCYIAGEVPYPDGYGSLAANRILHVHAKDGVLPPRSDRMIWGDVGAGEVDWTGQLSAMGRDGYAGMVSLETHWGGPGGDKFKGSTICARSLQRLVAEAA